jgi:hypothetical protein
MSNKPLHADGRGIASRPWTERLREDPKLLASLQANIEKERGRLARKRCREQRSSDPYHACELCIPTVRWRSLG